MIAPVAFFEFRKFVLEKIGRTTFQTFHDVTDGELGCILDVHVDMILADCSFEDGDVLGIADLNEEFSASILDISFENVVAILGHPDEMDG
jgi:hypothetical protein